MILTSNKGHRRAVHASHKKHIQSMIDNNDHEGLEQYANGSYLDQTQGALPNGDVSTYQPQVQSTYNNPQTNVMQNYLNPQQPTYQGSMGNYKSNYAGAAFNGIGAASTFGKAQAPVTGMDGPTSTNQPKAKGSGMGTSNYIQLAQAGYQGYNALTMKQGEGQTQAQYKTNKAYAGEDAIVAGVSAIPVAGTVVGAAWAAGNMIGRPIREKNERTDENGNLSNYKGWKTSVGGLLNPAAAFIARTQVKGGFNPFGQGKRYKNHLEKVAHEDVAKQKIQTDAYNAQQTNYMNSHVQSAIQNYMNQGQNQDMAAKNLINHDQFQVQDGGYLINGGRPRRRYNHRDENGFNNSIGIEESFPGTKQAGATNHSSLMFNHTKHMPMNSSLSYGAYGTRDRDMVENPAYTTWNNLPGKKNWNTAPDPYYKENPRYNYGVYGGIGRTVPLGEMAALQGQAMAGMNHNSHGWKPFVQGQADLVIGDDRMNFGPGITGSMGQGQSKPNFSPSFNIGVNPNGEDGHHKFGLEVGTRNNQLTLGANYRYAFDQGGYLEEGGPIQDENQVQEYVGPSHEEGGIPIDEQGQPTDRGGAQAEVQGGETLITGEEGPYIASDDLKDPVSGKTFAEASLAIERRYKNKNTKEAKDSKALELDRLKAMNEQVKKEKEQADAMKAQMSFEKDYQKFAKKHGGFINSQYMNGGHLPQYDLGNYLNRRQHDQFGRPVLQGGMKQYLTSQGGGPNFGRFYTDITQPTGYNFTYKNPSAKLDGFELKPQVGITNKPKPITPVDLQQDEEYGMNAGQFALANIGNIAGLANALMPYSRVKASPNTYASRIANANPRIDPSKAYRDNLMTYSGLKKDISNYAGGDSGSLVTRLMAAANNKYASDSAVGIEFGNQNAAIDLQHLGLLNNLGNEDRRNQKEAAETNLESKATAQSQALTALSNMGGNYENNLNERDYKRILKNKYK